MIVKADCGFNGEQKPTDYQCWNENSQVIGSEMYEVVGTASCLGKPDSSDCVDVKSVTLVTPSKPAPSPPPVGTWIDTPFLYVPQDIRTAAFAYMMKNAKIMAVAPAETLTAAYYGRCELNRYGERKIDANGGGVTYRISADLYTKSAAKGCEFPILNSETSVEVKKTGGKYIFSSLTDYDQYAKGAYGKAFKLEKGTGRPQPACIGKPAWKAGVAKVDKFCSTAKGGCARIDEGHADGKSFTAPLASARCGAYNRTVMFDGDLIKKYFWGFPHKGEKSPSACRKLCDQNADCVKWVQVNARQGGYCNLHGSAATEKYYKCSRQCTNYAGYCS
jgi:hypothetical protein